MHAAVSGLIPSKVGNNKKIFPATRRDGGAEPQSLVSVPNIPGLNPKSLRSVYEMKAYVLFIAICRMGR